MANRVGVGFAILLALAGSASAQTGLPRTGGMVSLDFHDVDIQDVVKSISEITGKNFILDDRVRGKISMVSPSPVTIEDAYQMFLSALEMKNLCTVDIGKATKVVPLRECKGQGGKVEIDSEVVKSVGDEVVTRLITLSHISANDMRQALNPLVSKTGSIVAYGPSSKLIITDSAANIDRLMKIVQTLDKPGFKASVEVIPLRHAEAKDVADKLLSIFEKEKQSGFRRRTDDVEAGDSVQKIIPDSRTNSLIVVATRDGLGRVVDLLGDLDRKVTATPGAGRIHVKYLQHADAEELAGILTALISGSQASKKGKDSKKSDSNRGFSSAAPLPWEEGGGLGDTQKPADPFATNEKSGNGIVSGGGKGGMFEDEVHLVADTSMNALVITATPSDYSALTAVIDELDVRRRQVFVEALIMEVNLKKAMEVGLSGHGGSQQGDYTLFGGSSLGKLTPLGLVTDPKSMQANAAGLVLGGFSRQQFKFPGTNILIPIQAGLFKALQEQGALNVLSVPNILTTDNKKAEILVGADVPMQTSQYQVSGTPVNSFSREKIGIQLAVTPHINDGDEVTLEIEQKIQEIQGQVSNLAEGKIVTSERSAKTTVVAQDGQTIVIGGLIKDKEDKSVNKVPLLGDIPILGYLFRQTSVSKEKTNLTLFLTPHVIHSPQDLTRISVKKNTERQRFNKSQGIPENRALYDYELDKGLNMAPPPPRVKKEGKEKKRFDYDRPAETDDKANAEEEVASRRRPKVQKETSATAEADTTEDSSEPLPRRAASAKPAATSSSPFADVRPPSSSDEN